MLPCSFWQSIEAGFDPVVSGLLPAWGTEPGFACVRSLDAFATYDTDEEMVSKKACTANKEFQDIDYDTFSD